MRRIFSFLNFKTYLPFAVFLIPFVFNPWGAENPSELTKVVFVFLCAAILAIILSIQLFTNQNLKLRYNNKVLIFSILWALSFILSTVFALAPVESFWGTYQRLAGLITFLPLTIIGIYLFHLLEKQENQIRLINFTIIAGGVIALYGIIQLFLLDYDDVFSIGRLFSGRIYSLLSNPTDLGQFLIFPLSACIVLLTNKFTNKNPALKIKNPYLIFLILASILEAVALFLCKNRSSMIALGIVLSIYLLIKVRKSISKIIIGLLIVLTLIIGLNSPLNDSRSFNSRLILWKSSLNLTAKIPLFGFGPESFYQAIQPTLSPKIYQYEKLNASPESPHNLFLSTFIEEGYFGLLLLIGAMSYCIYRTIKHCLNPKNKTGMALEWSILSIVATLISLQFSYFSITTLIFFISTLIILFNHIFKFKNKIINPGKTIKIGSALVLILISILLSQTGAKLIVADITYSSVYENLFLAKNKALEQIRFIINLLPQYRQSYDPALFYFRDDLSNNPQLIKELTGYNENFGSITNYGLDYHAQKGTIDYFSKQPREAIKEFEIAAEMAPNTFKIYQQWAIVAYLNKDFKSAYAASEKALSFASEGLSGKAEKDLTPQEEALESNFIKSNPILPYLFEINSETNQKAP